MPRCPHDLCGLQGGRLTPCTSKVLPSANQLRFGRYNPRHCPAYWPWSCPVRTRVRGQSMPASSPRPRPQTVHGRGHSATWIQSGAGRGHKQSGVANNPWPRTGNGFDCPRTDSGSGREMSADSPRTQSVRECGWTKNYPRHGLAEASLLPIHFPVRTHTTSASVLICPSHSLPGGREIYVGPST